MMTGEMVTVSGSAQSNDVVKWFLNPDEAQILFEDDPEEVAARIVARQIGAASAEELFGVEETLHAKDMIGVPLQFLSAEWRPSQVQGEGLPFFGVFRVADADGEVRVLTCGAASVCMKLAIADARGWLPHWLKIVLADEETKNGRRPMDIVAAKAPVGTGEDRF